MKKIINTILFCLFFIIGFAFIFSINAYAYIDPSVMTYTIQAVAGIIIAVGAFIGIYYRKMKKKVNDKLGIDENKNKEVESDDIIMTASTKEGEESKKD